MKKKSGIKCKGKQRGDVVTVRNTNIYLHQRESWSYVLGGIDWGQHLARHEIGIDFLADFTIYFQDVLGRRAEISLKLIFKKLKICCIWYKFSPRRAQIVHVCCVMWG